jgi:uncharacterized membrane protein YagU involved in acid resistance
MVTYFERKKINVGEAVYSGIMAGIIAGLVMSMVAMAAAMMMGQEIWAPPKMIAVTVLDPSWLDRPGFQMIPLMVGMMIHFVTAIGFGILFALIGGRLDYGRAIKRGIVYGLAIWLFMQFISLPIINPVMADMPYVPFAMEHAVFGGFLGVYLAFLPSPAESQAKAQRERRVA